MRAHRLFSFRTLSVVAAAALLILSGLKVGEAIVQDDTDSEAATATQPAPRLVLTGLLSSENVSPSLTAYGQIKARRILEIRPSVAGRLADVSERMLAGGFVEKGELLFRVDPEAAARKVREAKASLAQAEANVTLARVSQPFLAQHLEAAQRALDLRKLNAGRKGTLASRQLTSTSLRDEALVDVAQAERDVIDARKAVATAEADIARADADREKAAASLEEAEALLARSTIDAPFSGYFADVAAVSGQMVGEQDRLGTLVDLRLLDVEIVLRSGEYARLLDASSANGLRRQPIVASLDLQDRIFEARGVIERSAPQVGSKDGGRLVIAALDIPPGSPMRPGDFVTVRIEEAGVDGVSVVPQTAIDADNRLLVVAEGNRLEEVTVEVVRRVGSDVLVRGAPVGRMFLLSHSARLEQGTHVQPRLKDSERTAAP